MRDPLKFLIIEGIDNIGKGTLIDGLIQDIGYHTVLKYSSPRKTCQAPIEYQRNSFIHGFHLMGKASEVEPSWEIPNLIFDRFHLGEDVYSPMYRKYDGSYVFQLERTFVNQYPKLYDMVGVIFLRASNFEIIQDDGKSFDHSAGRVEQEKFISAYQKCSLKKTVIDVHDSGIWKSKLQILEEAKDFRLGRM